MDGGETLRAQAARLTRALLERSPDGAHWTPMRQNLSQAFPETPKGTIKSALRAYLLHSGEVEQLDRGLYALTRIDAASPPAEAEATTDEPTQEATGEGALYEPFSEWLVNEDQSASAAVALGRTMLREKWATPDVVGVLRPDEDDPFQYPAQIVSAEIKTARDQSLKAVAQAACYQAFSHKAFAVLPQDASSLDRAREFAARTGVGIVLFSRTADAIHFESVSRPLLQTPDPFDVNLFARTLRERRPKLFQKLFED